MGGRPGFLEFKGDNDLQPLLNKILLILRGTKIENSSSSIDKIWFMVQVEKLMAKENKD